MKITSDMRDLIVTHLSNHLSNLIQERHIGLASYHHGHKRQFEFAREKDIEIQEVRDLTDELNLLDEKEAASY